MASKLYRIWTCMKHRCYGAGEKNAHARWYRDRGIEVNKEWRESFKAFEIWALTNGYKEGLTIDRIDPDGDYCPENCRWVTMSENSKRSRHSCSVSKKVGNKIIYKTPARSKRTSGEKKVHNEKEVIERFKKLPDELDGSAREKFFTYLKGAVSMAEHMRNI